MGCGLGFGGARYYASEDFRQAFRHLLLATWPGQTVEEEAGLAAALDDVLNFYRGDLISDRLVHFCTCCGSREEAISKGTVFVEKLLFKSGGGIQRFMTTRWLKQVPALKWFARFLLIHNLGRQALDSFTFAEEEERDEGRKGGKGGRGKGRGRGGAAAGGGVPLVVAAAETQKDDLGVRLQKARDIFRQRRTRFWIALLLLLLTLLDSLAYVLFRCSEITLRKRSRSEG